MLLRGWPIYSTIYILYTCGPWQAARIYTVLIFFFIYIYTSLHYTKLAKNTEINPWRLYTYMSADTESTLHWKRGRFGTNSQTAQEKEINRLCPRTLRWQYDPSHYHLVSVCKNIHFLNIFLILSSFPDCRDFKNCLQCIFLMTSLEIYTNQP